MVDGADGSRQQLSGRGPLGGRAAYGGRNASDTEFAMKILLLNAGSSSLKASLM
jgi:hypothetical protein